MIDDLPFTEFTEAGYKALCIAYAESDFRCPIHGCEPYDKKLADLRDPAAVWLNSAATPREGDDLSGSFLGLGVEFGLGGQTASSVKI